MDKVKIEFPEGFDGVVLEHDPTQSWEFRPIAYTRLVADSRFLVDTLQRLDAGTFKAFSRADLRELQERHRG